MHNERLDQSHDWFEEWVHEEKLASGTHEILHLLVEVRARLMTKFFTLRALEQLDLLSM